MLRKLTNYHAVKLIVLLSLINSSIYAGFMPQGMSPLRIFIALAMIISVGLLLIFSVRALKTEAKNIPVYFKLVFFLMFLWVVFMIGRSVTSNINSLFTLFFHYLMAWAWVVPIAFLLGMKVKIWLSLFDFIGYLFLFPILLLIFYFTNLRPQYFGLGIIEWVQFSPILILTIFYQRPITKRNAIIGFFVFILTSLLISERVNILFIAFTLIFFFREYYKIGWININKKIITTVFILLSFIFVAFLFKSKIEKRVQNNQELTEDTRTFLFIELFSDLNDTERAIGRGVLGKYYSPYFSYTRDNNLGGDASERSSVEVGYLEMILKGGYVLFILYLLILIPAAYLGIFKAKNIISRMAGYYIFLYLVIWSISYYPVYSPEFIFLWMAVGATISKKVRNIQTKELVYREGKNLFFKKVKFS